MEEINLLQPEQAEKTESIQDDIFSEDAVPQTEPIAETAAFDNTTEAEPIHTESEAICSPKAPVNKKKLLILLGAIAVGITAVFFIIFFTVIKPNATFRKAEEALHIGDFFECERLLNKIPNHEGTPSLRRDMNLAMAQSYIDDGDLDMAESLLAGMPGDERAKVLKEDIQYYRASELAAQGKIDDAQIILDKIPNHEDPNQLREQISYAQAMAAIETGDYESAYEKFSQLGQYKDAAEQKEIVYYEALAFKSLFNIQPTLKNPASLRVTKVTFYNHKTTQGELNAIYEITATNSYGGSLGAYGYDITLYDEKDDSGMISHSDYVDQDDYLAILEAFLVDNIKEEPIFETSVDVARMNRLLEANATFKIDLPFQSGTVVEN